jgi:hypothetical protein
VGPYLAAFHAVPECCESLRVGWQPQFLLVQWFRFYWVANSRGPTLAHSLVRGVHLPRLTCHESQPDDTRILLLHSSRFVSSYITIPMSRTTKQLVCITTSPFWLHPCQHSPVSRNCITQDYIAQASHHLFFHMRHPSVPGFGPAAAMA